MILSRPRRTPRKVQTSKNPPSNTEPRTVLAMVVTEMDLALGDIMLATITFLARLVTIHLLEPIVLVFAESPEAAATAPTTISIVSAVGIIQGLIDMVGAAAVQWEKSINTMAVTLAVLVDLRWLIAVDVGVVLTSIAAISPSL